jgi:tight adherence protein C
MNTNYIVLLSTGVGFIVIFLMCSGIARLTQARASRRKVLEKMKTYTDNGHAANIGADSSDGASKKGFQLKLLRRLGAKISPEGSDQYSLTKKRLLKAGIQWEGATSAFWGIKILLPVLLIGVFAILMTKVFEPIPVQLAMSFFIFFAAGGFYLPELWLSLKAMMRREEFFRGLPDAFDLMVVCVEAGMGLDATINRVGKEMALSNKVVSGEFKLINLELRAGKSREDALRNLALRTDLEDVRSLVTLLVQTEKFGTSIAKSLRVFSDTFRSRRFQKAEEIAAKMPIKLIFPLILFIFPAMFIVTVGPGAIRIYQNILMR